MNINKVHPELRKIMGRIPTLPLQNRLLVFVINTLQKVMQKPKSTNAVSIEEIIIGSVRVRVYRPKNKLSNAGLLWIHGGGFIIGTAAMNDKECYGHAKDLGLVVVSVDYRLAPKYPFPAAIDDCFAAWQWFQAEAKNLGVNPSNIVLAGQSAGGGLAAVLAQRIYDDGRIQPVGQALFSPMLDDRTAARHELDAIKHRIWNNVCNRAGWTNYLGKSPGQSDMPEYAAAARRKDLSGLPPAWIAVGDVDLFYDEDQHYAKRLTEAGVECQFYVVPMAPHGFETFAPHASITRDLYRDFYRFLRSIFKKYDISL